MTHGDRTKRKRAEKQKQFKGSGKPMKGTTCSLCGRKDPVDGAPCPSSPAGMPHLVLD